MNFDDPAWFQPGQKMTATYTNYRGETAVRRIMPAKLWYGSTDYHPMPQYILTALDLDKQADRDFALADMAWDGADIVFRTGEIVAMEHRVDRITLDLRIVNLRFGFGATTGLPQRQAIITAIDLATQAECQFVLADLRPAV